MRNRYGKNCTDYWNIVWAWHQPCYPGGSTRPSGFCDYAKRETLDSAAKNAGVSLSVLQLDVQKPETVQHVVDQIIAETGRIDTLINNAGVGFVRNIEQCSEEEIQWVLDVNFMGVVRCTKAVLPHMRKARSGHVISVTSVGGLVGQPFNEIYCGSKFAVEGFVESLATYVTPNFGIHFTAVEPGGITSEFASNIMKQIGETGGMLDDEYLPILQTYIGGSENRQAGQELYQTADEVAAVVIDCLETEDPPVRKRTSEWAEEFARFKTNLDPDGKKQQANVIEELLS